MGSKVGKELKGTTSPWRDRTTATRDRATWAVLKRLGCWPGSVTFGSYHDPEEEEQGRAAAGSRLRDVT